MHSSATVSTLNNSSSNHILRPNNELSSNVFMESTSSSPNSPNSPSSDYSNNESLRNNELASNNNSNIQFKNYTVRNPPGFQQQLQQQSDSTIENQQINHLKQNDSHYPTPNHTPVPPLTNASNNSIVDTNAQLNSPSSTTTPNPSTISPKSAIVNDNTTTNTTDNIKNTVRRKSVINTLSKDIKPFMTDLLSGNVARDANGYPILSREFVVRRISEGETGRLKEELKCEACGKGYKHITSLAKHLWEHTAEWQSTKKLLISKHQQAQLLEAASILCSLSESSIQPSNLSNSNSSSLINDSINSSDSNKLNPLNPSHHHIQHQHQPLLNISRRKSKSENTKAGKFGGKRRSKSFSLQNNLQQIHHNHKMSGLESDESPLGPPLSTMNTARRGSQSILPPSDLRRSSNATPSISFSASRRGSLLGSLIKEERERKNSNGGDNSLVIYDSDDE